MLRRCDRYLLREAVGPFALALAGLILFILLNIILSLSDLMVDRGIGMLTLLRLVALKMPSLLVIAVPMSALFATFLGLGRMAHDREIVALESIGIPLRRILLPLIIASVVVGAADFAIYNWGVPASEHAYQQELRSVIFRQGVPRITANAFFKGADNQFFYIRRYDEEAGTLHDVYIYDTTGRLFPHADSRVTMITANTGQWTGASWQLEDGRVYGFDLQGVLVYSGSFEELVIPLEQSVDEILAGSRTPAEMGIGELLQRIAVARQTGQRADEYIVEAHLKGALPFATVVFVLLGGALSLAFNPRSRAVGIVIGLLLVGLFQGTLWWTQTLGRRGAMNPVLAAWIPDLIFGAFGLFLFLRVDRLANRDLWSRWRGRISWFSCLLILLALPVVGHDAPIDLACDELTESEDGRELHAEGSVFASFGNARLQAERLDLVRESGTAWLLEATGAVRLGLGDGTQLEAARLVARVTAAEAGVRTEHLDAEAFCGESLFVNSAGDEHEIRFRVEAGSIAFDETGAASIIDARNAELTTCDRCTEDLRDQPYTLSAKRLLLYPERLLVAFGLTTRVAGTAAFWLPVYVRPLDEGLESPLFPAFGTSSSRGLFIKWNLPFFLSERLFGAVLLDYFSRQTEIGIGALVRYSLFGADGFGRIYHLPAEAGGDLLAAEWEQSLAFGHDWEGRAEAEFERAADEREFSFAGRLESDFGGGEFSISASRESEETDEDTFVEEHLPELKIRLNAHRLGDLTVRPEASAGWIREWEDDRLVAARLRLGAQLQAIGKCFRFAGFTFAPEVAADLACYGSAGAGWERQESLTFTLPGRWRCLKLDWVSAFVHGASPFAFDRVKAEHGFKWRIEVGETPSLRLKGSYDLADGLDPLETSVTWGNDAVWKLVVTFDAAVGRMEEVDLKGTWEAASHKLTWRIPYEWADERFDEASLALDVERGNASLEFSSWIDLNDASLASADVAWEQRTASDWGFTCSFLFVPEEERLSDLRFGVFRDIADCVRLGVERDLDEFWVYVSIIAFPEAVLRYVPWASDAALAG